MKTLVQHLVEMKEKAEKRQLVFDRQSLNMFSEEIERDKKATVDLVRSELPKKILIPYGSIEFFPEYHNPSGLKDWLELVEEGFLSQPIPGFEYKKTKNWDISEDTHWMVTNTIKILPYKNDLFGKTFRVYKDGYNHAIIRSNERDVWGLTHHDLRLDEKRLERRRKYGTNEKSGQYFAYKVGIANDLVRDPTEEELEEFARRPLVKYVFGIEPPSSQEILQTLMKIHSKEKETKEWEIVWTDVKELDYPVNKGVFSVYKDAKESGLFEKLEFGLLEERRNVVDPVLAGTYKGFIIPLYYWA